MTSIKLLAPLSAMIAWLFLAAMFSNLAHSAGLPVVISTTVDSAHRAYAGFTIATYSWDLTGRGLYIDSTLERPSFTVTGLVGQVAPVCLEVVDSYGKTSSPSCATVTTVP